MEKVFETKCFFLRSVPFEKGFHFCYSRPYGGVYTGVTATNLEDFAFDLKHISVESIEFHYPRGDFQQWVTKIVGDVKLGNRMFLIDKTLSGKPLKAEIAEMVAEHISQIKESANYHVARRA